MTNAVAVKEHMEMHVICVYLTSISPHDSKFHKCCLGVMCVKLTSIPHYVSLFYNLETMR